MVSDKKGHFYQPFHCLNQSIWFQMFLQHCKLDKRFLSHCPSVRIFVNQSKDISSIQVGPLGYRLRKDFHVRVVLKKYYEFIVSNQLHLFANVSYLERFQESTLASANNTLNKNGIGPFPMLDFFPIGRLNELQHFVNVLRSDVPNGWIRVIFRTKVIVKIGSSDNVMRPDVGKWN